MNYKISGFADEISQDLGTQIKVIKSLKMDYIDMRGVYGRDLVLHNDERVKEIKRMLDDNGVRLSAVSTQIGKIGINDPFGPHFEDFKRAVEVSHMVECPKLRMFSFYIPQGHSPAEYETEVFDRLGRLVDYASSNDVLLMHENEKEIYGEKAPECRRLMDTFYGDHFKGVFDFANFVQVGQDTLEAYDMLRQFTVYVHVKDALSADATVVPSGCGDGHVAEILKDMFRSGYDGFLSLEPHLFDFAGFAALEKHGLSIKKNEGALLSGEEAFTLAHDALIKILEQIG